MGSPSYVPAVPPTGFLFHGPEVLDLSRLRHVLIAIDHPGPHGPGGLRVYTRYAARGPRPPLVVRSAPTCDAAAAVAVGDVAILLTNCLAVQSVRRPGRAFARAERAIGRLFAKGAA